MRTLLFVLIALVTTVPALASAADSEPGQELTTIVGTNVDMKLYDHAMAGSIKDYVAWGFFDEAGGSAELIVRKYGQTVKTVFTKQANGKIGGTMSRTVDGKELSTTIQFMGVASGGPNKKIVLDINGTRLEVEVIPGAINGTHMVNAEFRANYNGEEIRYTMGGEGCFGKFAYFTMMIFGAYLF